VRELMTRKEITVDLETRTVDEFSFELDDFTRDCLLNGWDDIALTLRHEDAITAFEAAARA
jgi:3-isopropylmalate dehydratase small subunit